MYEAVAAKLLVFAGKVKLKVDNAEPVEERLETCPLN